MELINTGFAGLTLVKPKIFEDDRGYFYESYNKKAFVKLGVNFDFVQDNQSLSSHGIIRGLHYQLKPHAQTKLVRVIEGAIYDVAVDIRKGSDTYGKWFGVELSGVNKLQLLIPHGFAHGFSVLSENAVVLYKTDDFYDKDSERGIAYNDPFLNVQWQIAAHAVLVSERDSKLPYFNDSETNFVFGK
jgi:dTDP-4-dehydrorhamnose 3,5-epimerase